MCVCVHVCKGCLCMSAKPCVKRCLKVRCAVACPLVCVREIASHGQNGYMEPFTFMDTDTDMDTCIWRHPLPMTGDPKIFMDADMVMCTRRHT